MKPSDPTLEEQSVFYNAICQRVDPKEAIKNLIRQDGFSKVAKTLGDIAAEEETLLRIRSDSNLRQAFEIVFLAMMDCYKGASKKNKKWIKILLETDALKYSLDLCNWSSDNQCPAMKEAYKTVKEWEKENGNS